MWFAKIQQKWWLSIEFCREPTVFYYPKNTWVRPLAFEQEIRSGSGTWKQHPKKTLWLKPSKVVFLMASWAEQPTTLGSQSGANVYQLSGAPICASLQGTRGAGGWHHPVDANCSVVNSIPSYEHQLWKWCFWNFTLPPSVSFWNANSLVSIQYFVMSWGSTKE